MVMVRDESVRNGSPPDHKEVPTGNLRREKFHRIAKVRRQQGVSLRTAARQLETSTADVRMQEQETYDLKLSELIRWQQVLNVPLQDLLVDPAPPLSQPVMERARLVRLMKTAAALSENVQSTGARRLAAMLIEQLVEIMPELADVSPWHSVGQRRGLDEFGRVFERRICDDLLRDRRDHRS